MEKIIGMELAAAEYIHIREGKILHEQFQEFMAIQQRALSLQCYLTYSL
jgi:hypothetical protein